MLRLAECIEDVWIEVTNPSYREEGRQQLCVTYSLQPDVYKKVILYCIVFNCIDSYRIVLYCHTGPNVVV